MTKYILNLVVFLLLQSAVLAQTAITNHGSQIKIATGSYVVIRGDLVNKAGGTSDIDNSGTLKISGNIIDSATTGEMFSTTSGKIVLSGINIQSIKGKKDTHFYDIEIDNPSGVILDTAIFIHNTLGLTNGIIFSSTGKELNMLDGSSYTGGSDNSFVDGPMIKTGNTDFIFPVGDKNRIQQIAILDLSSSETFTAEYVRGAPPQNTNFTGNLTRVSTVEYWHLTPSSGTPQINMALYWNNGDSSGVTNPQTLLIAHQKSDGQWEDIPYISGTGAAASGSIKGGPVSTYSLYTLGTSSSTDNPLPIELLSFEAYAKDNFTVDLTWITASEQNNDFFTVERSQYGKQWEEVGILKGAGNSNQILRYALTDYSPFEGISYYRLKQTDYDGSFTFSEVRSINFKSQMPDITLYPNPATDFVFIKNISHKMQYTLSNMMGEIVAMGYFTSDSKLHIEQLPTGVYNLRLFSTNDTNSDIKIFRIIKN